MASRAFTVAALVLGMLLSMLSAAHAACAPNALNANTPNNNGSYACICPSWTQDDFGTGACSPLQNSNGMPLAIRNCPPSSTASSQAITVNLGGMGVKAGMDGKTSLVQMNVTIPAMWGRIFTQVGFTSIGATGLIDTTCLSGSMFRAFAANKNDQENCVDKWSISVDFYDLLRCGMAFNAQASTAQYQTYDLNLKVKYNETVTLGTDQYATAVTRTVDADFPIRLNLLAEYSATLETATKVYTNYKVDFAIIAQTVPKVNVSDAAAAASQTATMAFAYTVQFPYAIKSFDSVVKGAPNAPENTPFDVRINGMPAGAPVVLTGSSHCSTLSNPNVPDYAAYVQSNGATAGQQATCTKKGNFLLFSGLGANAGACQFGNSTAANQYTVAFSVDCGTGVSATDCPLGLNYAPGTNTLATAGNFVTFSVRSENFCVGQVSQTINNAVTITNFTAVDVNDFTTPHAGWRYGDKMFMRMDFTGVSLVSCKLVSLVRKWSRTDMTSGDLAAEMASNVSPSATTGVWSSDDVGELLASSFLDDRSTTVPNVLVNMGELGPGGKLYGKALGLQHDTGKSYWLTIDLVQDFLGFSAAELARGGQMYLKMYATVDVTYPTTVFAGRRRRQVNTGADFASGQGSIESTVQTVSAPGKYLHIAANSNSDLESNGAAYGVPSFAAAVAVALLSAVALL